MKAETVHLEEHFTGKEHHEKQIGDVLKVVEPWWLPVMFRCQDARVQKDQSDNQPKHGLRFDGPPTISPGTPVELVKSLLLFLPPGGGFRIYACLTSLGLRSISQFSWMKKIRN